MRLLAEILPDASPPDVAFWELGEYAGLRALHGQDAADATFPNIATVLAAGKPEVTAYLEELTAFGQRNQVASEALKRYAASQPFLDAVSDASRELLRYYQRRWDPDTLADIAHLDEEFHRRLKEASPQET